MEKHNQRENYLRLAIIKSAKGGKCPQNQKAKLPFCARKGKARLMLGYQKFAGGLPIALTLSYLSLIPSARPARSVSLIVTLTLTLSQSPRPARCRSFPSIYIDKESRPVWPTPLNVFVIWSEVYVYFLERYTLILPLLYDLLGHKFDNLQVSPQLERDNVVSDSDFRYTAFDAVFIVDGLDCIPCHHLDPLLIILNRRDDKCVGLGVRHKGCDDYGVGGEANGIYPALCVMCHIISWYFVS